MLIQPKKPAVIIGNPDSIFPRRLASFWRSLGLDVFIVTGAYPSEPSELPDGTRIVAAEAACPPEVLEQLPIFDRILLALEYEEKRVWGERLRKAMADWGEGGYEPSIAPAVRHALVIPNIVRSLDPMFVFGQEAFSYGLATALCHGVPRLLMPWGGDIYNFAETSPVAFALVKCALHGADIVVPTSAAAARHIAERFEVAPGKIRPVSWGVDRNEFTRADAGRRTRVCEKYGIDPGATICTNVRRFRPAWGAKDALRAFLDLAGTDARCHFIILAGQGAEAHVEQAGKLISSLDLQQSFTLFKGNIPLAEYAEVLSVTDVSVSLMRVPDMRSLSILQAAAAGAVPVLSDQPEYREMERHGFRALFVDPGNHEAVVRALQAWISDPEMREQVARANLEYLDRYENERNQMSELLQLVDDLSRSHMCGRSTQADGSRQPDACLTTLRYLASTSAPAESAAQARTASASAPKVLLIRSCRTPVYEQAVLRIRQLDPQAEIWGLAQPGFLKEVLCCGVHDILPYPRRWYGMFRVGPALVRRIRRLRFDTVAIPYMAPDDDGYANVHRMAFLFGAPRYLIVEPGGKLRTYSRREFRKLVLRSPLAALKRRLDVPLMFTGLLAALFIKRFSRVGKARPGKKRVLHIINSLGLGGAQTQLMELLNRTPSARYEAEILLVCGSDDEISRARLQRPEVAVSYLANWPKLFPSLLEIKRICRKGRYDVVHTWLFHANVIGAAGARLARCPRIVSSIRSYNLGTYPWMCRWWFRMADTLASRISDVVTVNAGCLVSDHARWARLAKRRIHVVHNGFALDAACRFPERDREPLRKQLNIAPADLLIGTSGRLAREKGQSTFIHMVQRLRGEFPAIHGMILGDGELRHGLIELARDLGLQDCIHFLGQQEEPLHFVSGLDLFVLPSCIEGFPNALLEAAFLGVPCVASDVGGAREILGEEGLLFQPGDVEAACRKARDCLKDPEAARRAALRIQARVKEAFSAERMVFRWLSFYEGDSFQGVNPGETRSDPVALLP